MMKNAVRTVILIAIISCSILCGCNRKITDNGDKEAAAVMSSDYISVVSERVTNVLKNATSEDAALSGLSEELEALTKEGYILDYKIDYPKAVKVTYSDSTEGMIMLTPFDTNYN
ncbi:MULTISPECIES: hypothetical protein [unclassified Butyrivibrio]|uniref:hypothetical protein n=1 Tax=unclassified Butyrivibrio TaxID=2639466 RepID=UPI0003B2EB7F|nr:MULTISPECIES: hypothetical protein [unclassified Butyrivibrio]